MLLVAPGEGGEEKEGREKRVTDKEMVRGKSWVLIAFEVL